MKKSILFAAVLLLSATSVFADETKVEKENCGMTLGREFPGAKGALKTDADGNLVFEYDFSKGGRYVGVEIKLPKTGMKSYTLSFSPKQNTRASVVVLQADGRIETKRRHYIAGDAKIVISDEGEFTKPGVEVDGTAAKILFRIEKSTNAPLKGSVVLKSLAY